jgi:hypothetical protein
VIKKRPSAGKPSRSSTGKKSSAAPAWAAFALLLARWVWAHLINRKDAWGRYLPFAQRAPDRKVGTVIGKVTKATLARHFIGADVGDLVGLHTTSPDNLSRWIAIDIDHHGDADKEKHRANGKAALALYNRVRSLGFVPLLVSSNGLGGYHVIVLFADPVPTPKAYAFARWLVRDWKELGLAEPPETFPKQPGLTRKVKFGNWLRLPGRHHTLPHYSKVWTGKTWADGEAAIRIILAAEGQPFRLAPAEAAAYDPEAAEKPARSTPSASTPGGKRRQVYRVLSQPRPVELVLLRLKNVAISGDQWSARCPAHNDHNNSLSVGEGDDGKVLLHCHAGCSVEEIVDELDLTMHDLFDRRRRRRPLRYRTDEEE